MVLMSSYLLLVMSVHSPSRTKENNNIVIKGKGKSEVKFQHTSDGIDVIILAAVMSVHSPSRNI